MEWTETISMLEEYLLQLVRTAFSEVTTLQIKMLIGFAAAQVPINALMWTNLIAKPGEERTEETEPTG